MSKHQTCKCCNRNFVGPDLNIGENLCPTCCEELHSDCHAEISRLTKELEECREQLRLCNIDQANAEVERDAALSIMRELYNDEEWDFSTYIRDWIRAKCTEAGISLGEE